MATTDGRPGQSSPAQRSNRFGRCALALLASLALANSSQGADYQPAPWLPARDANPFVAASGLPLAPPAVAADDWRVDVVLTASNTEIAFDKGHESLLFDGEMHEARGAVTRAFGERWLLRASIAGVRFGDGFLDGFIEDFHRLTGFSNGDRGRLDSNGHTIAYTDQGGERVVLDRRLRAVAPLLIDVVARAPADGHEWLYGATLKLPTSHASALIDDRAVDLSVWLAAQSTSSTRFPWGARVGLMQRGNTRLLADRARDQVPFADATIAYKIHPQWDVAAQLQWHRGLYDSAIPMLDSAATLTLSSAWRTRSGWTLRAGLVEDAIARHAQDVSFFVALSR